MLEIRAVKHNEVDRALTVLLSDTKLDNSKQMDKIVAFKDLSQREDYDLSRQIVACQDGKIIYSCLFVAKEGGTGFVLSSDCSPLREYAVQALRKLSLWAFAQGCTLLQVLLDSNDSVRRDICLHAGFRCLTDLIYLKRSLSIKNPIVSVESMVEWTGYSEQHYELFKKIIMKTYIQSLDCPEMEDLRDMEDVMKSHRAAGKFDPRWWRLLLWNDQPAGVLLMTPLSCGTIMELTYMGVCPDTRGRGFGKNILIEALQCGREYGASSIVLAVDRRNHFARDLYRTFQFEELFCRVVLINSVRWPQSAESEEYSVDTMREKSDYIHRD